MPNAKSPAALLSLSDRQGLGTLASALRRFGYRLIATAGTAAAIRELDLACEEVGELTGFPPLLDGRVKTLHPKILAGVLAEPKIGSHAADLERYEIPLISVVAVTLYPFERLRSASASPDEIREAIDIGGVTLLRAAAKNYENVSVLSAPEHYGPFVQALESGGPTLEQRQRLAAEAFALCERYDAAIAGYFGSRPGPDGELADVLRAGLPRRIELRYGENPWARAVFLLRDDVGGAGFPRQLAGKELSYNNLLDVDACLRLLAPPEEPRGFPPEGRSTRGVRAAIVKHTIPCGLAARDSALAALRAAVGADPKSAFGGIVACSAPLDAAATAYLKERFLEVVAAPAFDNDALALLAAKKNLRLLQYDQALPVKLTQGAKVRSALGGVLVEYPDAQALPDEWRLATDRQPTAAEWRDLLFASGAVRLVKSNAAVVAKDEVTLGVCGGQTNRVAAVELACERSGDQVRGAVLATDGFFPFADGVEAAARAGISAVVAPSGSIRDLEVVAAARAAGISLVFAKRRYFLH